MCHKKYDYAIYIYSLGTQMAAENGLTIICYPFDGPTVSPRFFPRRVVYIRNY